jgi:DNA-binding response OmpR family regulator
MASAVNSSSPLPPHGLRVLVVEDDKGVAELVRILLTQAGYLVVSAATGRAALAHLEGNDIDLIVLDLGFPDLGGLDICRRVCSRLGGTSLS